MSFAADAVALRTQVGSGEVPPRRSRFPHPHGMQHAETFSPLPQSPTCREWARCSASSPLLPPTSGDRSTARCRQPRRRAKPRRAGLAATARGRPLPPPPQQRGPPARPAGTWGPRERGTALPPPHSHTRSRSRGAGSDACWLKDGGIGARPGGR